MTRIDERQVITADNVKWLGEMPTKMCVQSSEGNYCSVVRTHFSLKLHFIIYNYSLYFVG